jgi:Na+/H+-dicarboxylate symporter
MFRSLPVQLVLCLFGGLFLGDFLSTDLVRLFYTISVLLKDVLMVVLPFIIFSYLFAAVLSFEQKGLLMILAVVVLVILSNAATVLTSYGVAHLTFPLLGLKHVETLNTATGGLTPLWNLTIPSLLSPDKAMLLGLSAGIVCSFFKIPVARRFSFTLRDYATAFLKKSFIPLLPLYVLGFVLKIDRDGALGLLITHYGQIFVLSCLLIVVYIGFMYLIAARFNVRLFLAYVKEMLPAGLTGFSTMSSAASMPVTLAATERNLGQREYADFVIPTTVNIHLMGDGLNIALTGLALLVMTGKALPDFSTYLLFTFYYCVAKFSSAGVPGGGVIVILPVIQQYLGLSPEATTMLATIYILQDPILTASNVMGNGAFALVTSQLLWRHKKPCIERQAA